MHGVVSPCLNLVSKILYFPTFLRRNDNGLPFDQNPSKKALISIFQGFCYFYRTINENDVLANCQRAVEFEEIYQFHDSSHKRTRNWQFLDLSRDHHVPIYKKKLTGVITQWNSLWYGTSDLDQSQLSRLWVLLWGEQRDWRMAKESILLLWRLLWKNWRFGAFWISMFVFWDIFFHI